MTDRFVCRFAVGQNNLTYSGVWRVWTAKNQPDLYLALRALAGEMKATVHCPRATHPGWKRHYGFPIDAASEIAVAAKKDGGPHKVQWTGCPICPSCTLEYRVIFAGKSLEKNGTIAPAGTALLPIPTEQEYVEVAVLLGPSVPTDGYPHDRDAPTNLISEGRLSDGRRVWVVWCTRKIKTNNDGTQQQQTIIPEKNYMDTTVDFSSIPMRAAVFGPQGDGSLLFLDMHVEYTPGPQRP
jgi:hypothetical protein